MKQKYRVTVWNLRDEPRLHLNKIVKDYDAVIKMKNKYEKKRFFEVHSWIVNEKGEPASHLEANLI